ncbi:glycosyl transferase group 1 [Oleiphilus messinensis]|uniref:Glycosyl transferase group 1 n=1 Tax=Oleiphilus messinensis TaxID=141451 RepID=A0A1Y0I4D5_9GAMM|nr:glycosyltransferase family 1 protein [Oleiphilus messinensis]ARU55281.1 glycosyl transferase group 1 [Oleiphilus messinensis]
MSLTKKITIVSETFHPEVNGVTNTLNHLVSGLQNLGHELQVIRPRQSEQDKDRYINHIQHVTVKGFPIPGYPELRFGIFAKHKLARLWKKNPPDAVYVATEGPLGWSAVSAATSLDIPVLTGLHTNFQSYSAYYGVGWLARFLIAYGRLFHNRSAGTIVPTHKMKTMIEGWNFKQVSVIGRGVNCENFSPAHRSAALREQWGVKQEDCAVIYVGRLAAEKNLNLAVKSYLKIHAKNPNTRFILVGDGPLRKSLESKYPEFHFAGMKRGKELSEHFASGDLFLFPSKTDTFGNVVTEAMASGLAVVAFDDAAASEYISNDINGGLVESFNEESYVATAQKYATTPSLLDKARKEARSTALSISWEAIIQQFEYKLLSLRPGDQAHAEQQQDYSVFSKNRSS